MTLTGLQRLWDTVLPMMKQVLIVTGAALLLAGCGDGGEDRVTAESVAKKCDEGSSFLTLSSDNTTIEYNFRPGTEKTEAVYNCLLKETSAPSSVDFKIQETRPIDGTQSANWDGWEITWSYGGKSEGSRIHLSEA